MISFIDMRMVRPLSRAPWWLRRHPAVQAGIHPVLTGSSITCPCRGRGKVTLPCRKRTFYRDLLQKNAKEISDMTAVSRLGDTDGRPALRIEGNIAAFRFGKMLTTRSGQFKNARNHPKEQGNVTFTSDLLAVVDAAGICDKYYGVCAEHPFRPGPPRGSISGKTVLAAAKGEVSLRKLQGPGVVFLLDDLPAGLALNFIIQGRTTVETDFIISHQGQQQRGTFAVLCHAALEFAGRPYHHPPYPRPMFSSAQELIVIMQKLRAVLIGIRVAS